MVQRFSLEKPPSGFSKNDFGAGGRLVGKHGGVAPGHGASCIGPLTPGDGRPCASELTSNEEGGISQVTPLLDQVRS